ncbi:MULTISPECIES: FAD-dependent oxidoreductase [Mycolicibacterium]|uniref:Mercuric reductase n=2 Tax=Mycolicibacterium TaxID=1866885 RepID=A0A0U1DUT0_9MYCO|nr:MULTISPECIES: FAD-dependent oxidoreductase [Mycolicibacterium]QZH66027.1 FAD-dependent oxidoreductase [Mycolicibacterium farcinogenes]CQD23217.1 mercuric reductase [Mycolicibacterium conceptionense]
MSALQHDTLDVDLAVIGYGKAGKTLAATLGRRGWRVAMIEQSADMYGGTCINIGCVPTKSFVHQGEMLPPGDGSHPDEYTEAARVTKELTTGMRAANLAMLTGLNTVTVLTGRAHFTDAHTIAVDTDGGHTAVVHAAHVVIGTGAVPVISDIAGLRTKPVVMTSTDPLGGKPKISKTPATCSAMLMLLSYIHRVCRPSGTATTNALSIFGSVSADSAFFSCSCRILPLRGRGRRRSAWASCPATRLHLAGLNTLERIAEMRDYGVVYDVGLRFTPEELSVEPFDPSLVAHDMQVIAEQLHANAVRIEGENIDRLVTAARCAHSAGLAVYFNPWKMNAGVEETRRHVAEAAIAAEQLRREGVRITFVTTCEFSIFGDGIYPGSNVQERIGWMAGQIDPTSENSLQQGKQRLAPTAIELNRALRSFAETVRVSFTGPVTYSAGAWEDVDWSVFDVVGVDYYRQGESDEDYRVGLRRLKHEGKPLAVMEFGCCAYEGAAPLGGGGFMVLKGVNDDGSGVFDGGRVPVRSESEQAEYVTQQLEVFASEDVDAAFVYVFSFPLYRYGEGAKDLDMMSYSLVKTFPDEDPRSRQTPPWEPKLAFERVADAFRAQA